MKVELALAGIILMALTGWLIGAVLEHPPGSGGLQILGDLIGALIAIASLRLGEALKTKEQK
ncbi:MAG: hypothetical protein ACUVUF_04945 [Candidatus Bathycorpusculaceae bacterium]